MPNQAPAPDRRLHSPLGSFVEFQCSVCAPSPVLAAAGEARRWQETIAPTESETELPKRSQESLVSRKPRPVMPNRIWAHSQQAETGRDTMENIFRASSTAFFRG